VPVVTYDANGSITDITDDLASQDRSYDYDKHEQSESDNNRNGVTHKTLQTEYGQISRNPY